MRILGYSSRLWSAADLFWHSNHVLQGRAANDDVIYVAEYWKYLTSVSVHGNEWMIGFRSLK